MIKELKMLIASKGASAVSVGLGYRSSTTIHRWIKSGKIPRIATAKVQKYINKEMER